MRLSLVEPQMLVDAVAAQPTLRLSGERLRLGCLGRFLLISRLPASMLYVALLTSSSSPLVGPTARGRCFGSTWLEAPRCCRRVPTSHGWSPRCTRFETAPLSQFG